MFRLQRSIRSSILVLIAQQVCSHAHAQCTDWLPGFSHTGTNGEIHALAVLDDGTGPAFYAGGNLTVAGDARVDHVARWDGTNWSPYGTALGNDGGQVMALAEFDDGSGPAIYAAGSFSSGSSASVNYLGKWDGSAWVPLGSGVMGTVSALFSYDDGHGPALYIGGNFFSAGGVPAGLARWDGTTWSAVGTGLSGTVYAFATYDDGTGTALYVGGSFTVTGVGGLYSVAKWNGTSWTAIGRMLSGGGAATVQQLAVYDSGSGPALYADGSFDQVDLGLGVHLNTPGIAHWNGTAWSAMPSPGSFGTRGAMQVFNDGTGSALYVLGATISGVATSHILRWNGTSWSDPGAGTVGSDYALTVYDDGGGPALFLGGSFTQAGIAVVSNIARFRGGVWSTVTPGNGPSDMVNALCVFDSGSGPELYAGGTFGRVGTLMANCIARWNGTSWAALGSGVLGNSAAVYAMAVFDDGTGPALYVGGTFAFAGGLSVNNLARWDGTNWSPVGSGMATWVTAFGIYNDGTGPALYVGGPILDRWDGTSLSVIPTGGSVFAQALVPHDDGSGPSLFVAGGFSSIGGVSASSVAKWNGTTWSALGAGLGNGGVRALTVYDDGTGPALFSGGSYNMAGGHHSNRVSKWDGTTWSNLTSGANIDVDTLCVFDLGNGPELCVGGQFMFTGGNYTNGIGRWDGTQWLGFGTGIVNPDGYMVSASAVYDSGNGPELYVGGIFNHAGSVVSQNIAHWKSCGPGAPGRGYCFGDGSGTACPCANYGAIGQGCANSIDPNGGLLTATGIASLATDSVVLLGSGMPNSSAFYFQGTGQQAAGLGSVFGDGLRCASGSIARLGTKINAGNASQYPAGGDLPVSHKGGVHYPGVRTYQIWYRNSAAFCTPSTFNLTNGLRVTWAL